MTDNKMPDVFDPKTHKFGMAYCDKVTGIVFIPTVVRQGIGYIALSGKSLKDGFVSGVNSTSVTRAPEHDLIPRATADKMAEVLQNVRDCQSGTIARKIAIQALAEYNAAKGSAE